jgi:hypothetical protein
LKRRKKKWSCSIFSLFGSNGETDKATKD